MKNIKYLQSKDVTLAGGYKVLTSRKVFLASNLDISRTKSFKELAGTYKNNKRNDENPPCDKLEGDFKMNEQEMSHFVRKLAYFCTFDQIFTSMN